MADNVTAEQRSAIMRRIHSIDTSPERRLSQLLLAQLGDEPVRRGSDLVGKPDFYLPNLCLAIFCDGCFFHGCPEHCRLPATNREYWEAKIKRNQARDRRITKALREQNIAVLRVWEHDLRSEEGLRRTERRIRRLVTRLSRCRPQGACASRS